MTWGGGSIVMKLLHESHHLFWHKCRSRILLVMCFDHPTRVLRWEGGGGFTIVSGGVNLGTRWKWPGWEYRQLRWLHAWSVNGVVTLNNRAWGQHPFYKTGFLQLFWDKNQLLTGITPIVPETFVAKIELIVKNLPRHDHRLDCLSIHAIVVIKQQQGT